MKKKLVLMLTAAMLAATSVTTSIVWAEETAADADAATSEGDVITTDTEDYRLLNEEGTVIQGDGYSMEVNWCGEEGKRIFGRTYYPADFDASKKYTTVVLNHGKSVNCDFWDKAYAPALAKAGYVCYTFDCRSCTEGGRGSFSDPLPDGAETTVTSYSEDLNMVLDYVEAKDYVDLSKLYLFGQSMGGMTVQNVAAQRADEIKGMVVLYGAIADGNGSLVDGYETLKAAPYANGEVLFILGALEGEESIQNTLSNMEWYENTSFMLISGAAHGFGVMPDRPAEICSQTVIDFLQRTSAEEE